MRTLIITAAVLLSGVGSSYAACNQAQLVGSWALASTQLICTIRISSNGKATGPCLNYASPGSSSFKSSTMTFKAGVDNSCSFGGKFGTEYKMTGYASFTSDSGRISGAFDGYGAFEMFR
jgi:hypothetical protein